MNDPLPCQGPWTGTLALVGYIPDPLAHFVNELRRLLEPTSAARAHVTLLPPRSVPATVETVKAQIRKDLTDAPPLAISCGGIEVFPGTNVVYLSVQNGFEEMQRLHERLNHGAVGLQECYPYHPHITLAQGLDAEGAARAAERARKAWQDYSGPRSFVAGTLVFVQGEPDGSWRDLATFPLQELAGVLR